MQHENARITLVFAYISCLKELEILQLLELLISYKIGVHLFSLNMFQIQYGADLRIRPNLSDFEVSTSLLSNAICVQRFQGKLELQNRA